MAVEERSTETGRACGCGYIGIRQPFHAHPSKRVDFAGDGAHLLGGRMGKGGAAGELHLFTAPLASFRGSR